MSGQTKSFRFIKDSVKYEAAIQLYGDDSYPVRHFRVIAMVVDGEAIIRPKYKPGERARGWNNQHVRIIKEEYARALAGSHGSV